MAGSPYFHPSLLARARPMPIRAAWVVLPGAGNLCKVVLRLSTTKHVISTGWRSTQDVLSSSARLVLHSRHRGGWDLKLRFILFASGPARPPCGACQVFVNLTLFINWRHNKWRNSQPLLWASLFCFPIQQAPLRAIAARGLTVVKVKPATEVIIRNTRWNKLGARLSAGHPVFLPNRLVH